ncbi:MAG: HAMP domain-containing sensor histidine kinase, partial [Peptococcaceae bacterium]|nr:HAMP domain-containing sensor histidine kinase [Peptococcaceae bacterium]
MSTLVGQFYDYSRLAADDMNLTLTRIDAGRVLRETLAGSYQLLANAHLKVDIDLPEHPLWVLGDQAALARIFQNLLQNAGRYAETCLALAANEESDHLTLRFSNDTTCLNDDDVAHLFDRFYTPDASRHQGGTGLGLTVARTLAEDMQGSLTASADTHDGKHLLTFTLTLKML